MKTNHKRRIYKTIKTTVLATNMCITRFESGTMSPQTLCSYFHQ